jgi:hypothetical protein
MQCIWKTLRRSTREHDKASYECSVKPLCLDKQKKKREQKQMIKSFIHQFMQPPSHIKVIKFNNYYNSQKTETRKEMHTV